MTFNPKLDLILERVVDVPPELVWKAWTDPEYVKQWFTPAPWTTSDCEIDLRPGGIYRAVMHSPEGEDFPVTACILEVVENRRLIWTVLLEAGYRPAAPVSPDHPRFTAIISMEPHGSGTKYTAHLMHVDEQTREAHGTMGFEQGWGTALDQLVAVMKRS
jgi:uncharacterized protein YndB with AHSA1/START domain